MSRRPLILLVAVGIGLICALGAVAVATRGPERSSSDAASTLPSDMPVITPVAAPSPGDVAPSVTEADGAGTRWRNRPAVVRFAAVDDASGVAATVWRVDSGQWRIGDKVVVKAPKDHSNDGEHVVEFYSVDNALNAEAPRSVTVRIDTRPPRFTWKNVSPAIVRGVEPVQCRFTIGEPTGFVKLSYTITDQYGHTAARKHGLKRHAGPCSVKAPSRYKSGKGFTPGVYRIVFTLRDEAGNVTVSAPRSFRDQRVVKGAVWYRVNGVGRLVALTFDDGGSAPWRSILNTFRSYRMHGTFFPLGSYVAADPALARRCVREGHGIGTHGWTHALMTHQTAGQIQSEWARSAAAWWKATGCSPMPYCRPPYGAVNAATIRASAAAGYCRVILWDVDPQDWSQPGAGVIASRVLSHVRPGSIVCLHLTPQTAAALPAILRGLRARGFKCVSLPELFRAAGRR